MSDLASLSDADLLALAHKHIAPAVDHTAIGAQNTLAEMGPLDKFNAGMGEAFTRIGQGAKQMIGLPTDYEQQKGPTEALNRTAPGMAGNVAGNIMAIAPASVVPGANTVAGAGAMGALAGALQPTDTTGQRVGNMAMGGGSGAGVQAISRYPAEIWDAAKGVGRGLKAAVEPLYEGGREDILARALRKATNGNPDVAARLAGAQELVPGSAPTAAEVGKSGGLAALQRSASTVDPEAYAARWVQQNEARVKDLTDLAGTQGARDFAAANRNSTAEDLYKQAYDMGVDLKKMSPARRGEITKLMRTPALQDAMGQAKNLAANEFVKLNDPAGSVKGLDYLKRALDDQIKNSTGNEQRVLVNLKDRLLTTIDTLSPEYGAARKVYQDMSKPINQMDISQAILDKSKNKLTGALQPAAYARALTDETAAGATGYGKATLENTLEPAQLSRLTNIKEDLARNVEARDLGRGPGSNTVQNLAMANLMQRSGMPEGVLNMPGLGRFGTWVYDKADEAMKKRLSAALLNPQDTASLLAKAPPASLPATTNPALGARSAMIARALALPAISMEAGR